MVRETKLYEVLEVEVTCTDGEIKKAYRRLSLIHHPDRQSGASGSSTPVDNSKFQEIQNAYETLSDPERRARYDRFGEGGGGGRGGPGGMDDFDEEDLMGAFFGGAFGGPPPGRRGPAGGGGPRQRQKTQTQPSKVELKVTLEELYNGKEATMEIQRARTCGGCQGSGARAKTKPRPCTKCQGQGILYAIRGVGPFVQRVPVECPECEGKGSKVRAQDWCKKCHGVRTTTDKKRVVVTVERGMTAGEVIILRGEGDESPDSSAPGDLHFKLKLTPHASFTVSPTNPLNLHTTISLTLSESILGFDRLVLVHLDRRGLRVNQPKPGERGWRVLKTGDLVVIKGEGLWRKGERGDLVCKVEVEMPGADWAAGLGPQKLEQLANLLPPKRADIEHNAMETDEVDLEEYVAPKPGAGPQQGRGRARAAMDSDEEQEGPPGCQQQ
ncbi:hypothetical protein RQP46_009995 [Phenoliferia psychrophenolica]